MIEKKRIEVFPKHMGFFPYMWLVYLAFPIYALVQEEGSRLMFGAGMLILFVLAYRQLYFVTKMFAMWACMQMVIALLFSFFIVRILFFYVFSHQMP